MTTEEKLQHEAIKDSCKQIAKIMGPKNLLIIFGCVFGEQGNQEAKAVFMKAASEIK